MHTKNGIAVERLYLKHLIRENVLDFLEWVMDERHCSTATRNYRLAAILAFVYYLQYNVIEQAEEWQKILSIKAMRTEVKVLNYLSPEGIRLLLQQPDTSTRQGRRHLAMLSLMYDMARKVNQMLIPERLSCHSIRHSKAMHLLQSGVNLVYIREILGYVSIQTADIYARADSKAKREALEKAYVDLNPEVKSDPAWERDKNLREWLKGQPFSVKIRAL